MKTYFALVMTLISFCGLGQTRTKVVNSGSAYLDYSVARKELEMFVIDNKNQSPDEYALVSDKNVLMLNKRQDFNFYLRWINPLKYKVVWIDSVSVDESYRQMDLFVSSLKTLYSLDASSATKSVSQSETKKFYVFDSTRRDSVEKAWIQFPSKVLMSNDIRDLYFFLSVVDKNDLSAEDLVVINDMKKVIEDFDKEYFSDFKVFYSQEFSNLVNLATEESARITVNSLKGQLVNKQIKLSESPIAFSRFNSRLEGINLKNKIIENLMKSKLQNAVAEAEARVLTEQDLKDKLDPLINIVDKSLSEQSRNVNFESAEYFRTKSLNFNTGEQVNASITIKEYSFDEKSLSFSPLDEEFSKEFVLRKYNFIYPTFSTGVFYSDTEIVTYGLSNGGDTNEFIVSQDTLQKNTALVAAFANFNFDLNSDFFHPFFQVGIDPTKIRPFLLLGGGIFVPASKFAISGGAVFTWEQSLEKLKVGDSVKSTTDLQNDIKYGVFDVGVKGWYLGIQYQF